MLSPVLVTAPAVLPVSLQEAKTHCRVDHSDEDEMIESLIKAAVAHLDGYTGILGRALVNQTWRVDLPCFPARIDIPLGPLSSLTSVQYYDGTDTQQTLATSIYGVYSDGLGPFITTKHNQQWPQIYTREDAVRVTWIAGHGATAASVPAAIRAALLLMIADMYENRSAKLDDTMPENPTVMRLLSPYRRLGM